MLDAFHVVKLATQVVDDVRRRVQQETTGHRGRKGDPLSRVRNVLRAGEENLTDRQRARLEAAFTARAEHVEVEVAYRCAQQVRSAYHQTSHATGRVVDERGPRRAAVLPDPRSRPTGLDASPVATGVPGYFENDGASNGGTEAVNRLIELHRRIACGLHNRDNYCLRMLLIAGGLHP